MKAKIDKYFLDDVCPFTKRAKVKWKNVKVTGLTLGLLSLIFLLVLTPNGSNDRHETIRVETRTSLSEPRDGNENTERSYPDPFTPSYQKGSQSSRQFGASQLVKRSESGNNGDKLPMGSTVAARLLTTVLSSDSNSPVIAEITDDIIWKNSVIIPGQTRAIGQGSLDSGTERLQVRFNTLVYPEGDQHTISALALLADGSSGISGNYHSRTLPKHTARLSGHFLAGLAQGLKEKTPSGQYGLVFEPGSLKNGILGGISNTATDLAQNFTHDTDKLAPYLEVPAGTPFILYLEREYSP